MAEDTDMRRHGNHRKSHFMLGIWRAGTSLNHPPSPPHTQSPPIMAAKKTAKKTAKPATTGATPAPAAKKPAKKAATKAVKKTAAPKPPAITSETVARAAYLNYRRRLEQGLPGDSHGDWLEAERQLKGGA
jgi:hypothetical protein